jgi:hypothetical protein
MNRHLLLPLLTLSTGCDDFLSSGALDAPEFLTTEASCADGEMTFTALVRSPIDLGNLVLERSDIDGESMDPVFPLISTDTYGNEVTEWSTSLAHDCAASIAVTWTATTIFEVDATAQTAWPDVDLSEGVVDVPYGSDAGGSVVTISGSDMTEIDRVWFGDAPATLLSSTDSLLTVETPPHDAGPVDVRIAAGVTEQALPAAFTYWPDRSGQVTGWSRSRNYMMNPNWIGVGVNLYGTILGDGPAVNHELLFHEALDPEEALTQGVLADVDTCETGGVAWTATPAGNYLSIHEDTLGTVILVPTNAEAPVYYMVESPIVPEDWTGLNYDIEVPDGSEHVPPMWLEDAIVIPELPGEPSWDYNAENMVTYGEDLVFTWIPPTGAGGQLVNYSVFPMSSSGFLSQETCTADGSTGELTIPWEGIVAGIDESYLRWIVVRIGLVHTEEIILPHDNSIFEVLVLNDYYVPIFW